MMGAREGLAPGRATLEGYNPHPAPLPLGEGTLE